MAGAALDLIIFASGIDYNGKIDGITQIGQTVFPSRKSGSRSCGQTYIDRYIETEMLRIKLLASTAPATKMRWFVEE